MNPKTRDYIKELEDKNSINILGVTMVGSNAWGFSNKNSDKDLRFIYKHKDDSAYVFDLNFDRTIEDSSESIDSIGWDIKRFHNLICSNNPNALEALNSPIKLYNFEELEELREYTKKRFNIIELWIGYKAWCERMYNKYIQNDRSTVKRNLCAIRCMVNAEYIRQTHKYPNLKFNELIQNDNFTSRVNRADVEDIIEMKIDGLGSEIIGNIFTDDIEAFINQEIGCDFIPENHIRDSGEHIKDRKASRLLKNIID